MGVPPSVPRGLGRSLGVPLSSESFEHQGYWFQVTLGLSTSIVKPILHSGVPPAVLGSRNMLGAQDLAGTLQGLLSWDNPYQFRPFKRWAKTFPLAQGVTRQLWFLTDHGVIIYPGCPQLWQQMACKSSAQEFLGSSPLRAHSSLLTFVLESPVEAASLASGCAVFAGLGVVRPQIQGLILVNMVCTLRVIRSERNYFPIFSNICAILQWKNFYVLSRSPKILLGEIIMSLSYILLAITHEHYGQHGAPWKPTDISISFHEIYCVS